METTVLRESGQCFDGQAVGTEESVEVTLRLQLETGGSVPHSPRRGVPGP